MTKLTKTKPREKPQEPPSKVSPKQRLKALTYPFEVIISPLKAFKKIAQNPDFIGIILMVGLILLDTAAVQYASASKVFLNVPQRQQFAPKLHSYQDAYVYETALGNYTFKSGQPYIMNYTFIDKTPLIEYSIFWVNSTEPLTPVNPVVTIANDTFYQTTLHLNRSSTVVGNLTLTVKFFSDGAPKMSTLLTKTAQWNLGDFTINWFISSPYIYLANGTTTIDLASKTTLSLLQTNVTKAELGNTAYLNSWERSSLIDWSDHGNATLYGGYHTLLTYSGLWLDVVFNKNDAQIDSTTVGLTYSSLLTSNTFGSFLLSALFEATFSFLLSWFIFAGAVLLISRLLGEKGSSWRSSFTLVGYTFSTKIVGVALIAVLISTLPQINFQLSMWPPTTLNEAVLATDKISAAWGPTLAFQVGVYLNLALDVWLIILAAIAVHAYREIAWMKAAMISVTAYFIYFIVRLFIGG